MILNQEESDCSKSSKESKEFPDTVTSLGKAKLDDVRREIDQVDAAISELISARLNLVRKVADIKNEFNLPTLDGDREKTVIEGALANANDPVSAKVISIVYETLIKLCREHQNDRRVSSESLDQIFSEANVSVTTADEDSH